MINKNLLNNKKKLTNVKLKRDTRNRYFYTELEKGIKNNRYFYTELEKNLKKKNYNRWMYSYFK